jgi:hypothetical protein
MLIAEKYQFAFVHICKNGGNAITAALQPFSTVGNWDGDSEQKHWSALRIRNELLLDDWERYFTFAFISNPWRWLHSLYYYFVMTSLLYGSAPIHADLSKWKMWTIKNPGPFTKRWIQDSNENAAKGFEKFVTDECNDFCTIFLEDKLENGCKMRKVKTWFHISVNMKLLETIGLYYVSNSVLV